MPAPLPDDRPIVETAHQQDLAAPTPPDPLVVFVPGMGLDEEEWGLVRAGLSGPSIVLLLPSMGKPAPRHGDLRAPAQATRLLEGLPAGSPVVLVAHSASCPVVVDLATRSRDVVGLVLVGPVTDPAAASWPAMLVQWARTAVHEHLSEGATLARQWWRTGPLSMLKGMNEVRYFRTDLALELVRAPVEIVRGDKDRIATQRWSARLAQMSNGRLSTVEKAAHMVPLTHPDAVTAAVQRILATHRQPGPEALQKPDRGSVSSQLSGEEGERSSVVA